jgi:hypothetical protein
MGVKTIEEAEALPEVSFLELLQLKLGPDGIDGDDICAFVDSDGQMWRIESTENGLVKVREL